MAAYASLVSLARILDQILQHPPRRMILLNKAQFESLLEYSIFLQDFLEDFTQKRGDDETQAFLETRIARAAYAAEDIIESHVVDQILENSEGERERSSTLFYQDLQKVIEEFDSIKKDAMTIMKNKMPRNSIATGSSRPASDGKNTMVGFNEDLIQLMDILTGNQLNLQTISIVGMGGIGKTTLARNIYGNPLVEQHFHVRAWVTISQEYNIHEILLHLLKDIGTVDEHIKQETDENLVGWSDKMNENMDDQLGELVHKSLSSRRYLIVMDDMWSTEAWDDVKMFFPNNGNGSRVMVTTRQSNVATSFHSCSPHQLQFLNEDKSWTLFCNKVFAEQDCPEELEKIGKKIASNCRGLPLAIITIGGLLAKSSKTIEYWEDVAKEMFAAINMESDGHCFEILSLSYRHLPVHLKPCFLHMGIFPEDCEITISRLIKLWVAEGFLKPTKARSLEEVAKDNLMELIDRNLIRVNDYGSRRNIKTCSIHDLLRDLCQREAQKEKFFWVATKHHNVSMAIKDGRRLIIHPSSQEHQQHVLMAMSLTSCPRSLICNDFKSKTSKLPSSFRLLRVLDTLDCNSCEEILQLVNSRYISFKASWSTNEPFSALKSLSLLWNLQTIVITPVSQGTSINLPSKIWEMPLLRHLKTEKSNFYLPDPPSAASLNGWQDSSVLKNLQTFFKIKNFKCTDEVIRRIPNIKKLGIAYGHFVRGYKIYDYHVNNLVNLRNVESLFLDCCKMVLRNVTFPLSLKKLTLSHCGIFWEDLTPVGLLPNLEVLKLKSYAVKGHEWNPVEGQFLQLKFLLIESTDLDEWTADSTHFPSLETLVLRYVKGLKEIPSGIGDISTLRLISLDGCSESVITSAKEIQEEWRSLGNDDLHVHHDFSWKQWKQFIHGKRLYSTTD